MIRAQLNATSGGHEAPDDQTMKCCPQCHRVESDDSLAFCRVDGAALIQDSLNEDSGTIRFNSAPVSGDAQTNVLHSAALTDPGNRPVQQTTVGLGDKDSAFSWLEKDFKNRNSTLVAWMDFPPLNALRNDSRMVDLRQRMGLPQ